jgi:hypothetical protein
MSEARESFWEERGQHWTPQEVVDEILRIHRSGGRLRCNKVPVSLYEIGRRLFGTWRTAVEQAGLSYEEVSGVRRWNRRRVIERIQKLAADGVCLHSTSVQQHYPFLHKAAIKLFPHSWAKALRAAGFDPAKHRMPKGKWDRQKAESWVRKRAAAKRSLLAKDAAPGLFMFVHKHIGMNWDSFLESLGIPYPGIKKRRDWTKDKLLKAIRRWRAEGHSLKYRAVQSRYQALIHQARKFFGSWNKALAAAVV